MLIFEIFDRVARLQSLFLSEVSWLYTVFFYGSCLLVAYVVTAARRAADARLWIYLVLTANFLLERAVCNWHLPPDGGGDVAGVEVERLPDIIYQRVWALRKVAMGACAMVAFYFVYTYVDYNKVRITICTHIVAMTNKKMRGFFPLSYPR